MPPRQPLKIRSNASRRTTKKALAAAAAATLPELEVAPKKPTRSTVSPYPDLAMAIQMLSRRAANVAEGERKILITKWLESLTKINEEMQKLHKLENLATRLISPTGKE
jgi:hypothetical protein